MTSLSYSFDDAAFDAIDSNMRVMPRLMQTALRRREKALKRMALRIVAVPGKPVPRGDDALVWTSDLQRKAYFASNGFGAGIPYTRTDDLIKSWDAAFEFTPEGGGFSVWSTDPKAPFVVGEFQQPMFAGRWVNAPRVLDEFAPVVINDVEQTLITVGDPLAGVR